MDRSAALESFVKVVELGSFARAAERLPSLTSAVSRQIADSKAPRRAPAEPHDAALSLTEPGQTYLRALACNCWPSSRGRGVRSSGRRSRRGHTAAHVRRDLRRALLSPRLPNSRRASGALFDLDLSDRAADLVDEASTSRSDRAPASRLSSRGVSAETQLSAARLRLIWNDALPSHRPKTSAHDCLATRTSRLPNMGRSSGPRAATR